VTPDPGAPAPTRVYFPELDGLRFVAFLMVFVFHEAVPWPEFARVFGRAAARVSRENGWVGVQLFFTLSGFLITTLLLREEAEFGRVDLRSFWARRALRTWPLYYLTVAVAFGLMPWLRAAFASAEERAMVFRHLPWFLGFLGNWSVLLQGPVGSDARSVLWSVCVEEQFYLAVPLVVACVRPGLRVPLVAAAMAAAVAYRARLSWGGASPLWVNWNTFAQADTLLSGVLLALALKDAPGAARAGRWLRWLRWPLYGFTLWVLSRPTLGAGTPGKRAVDFVLIWAAGAGLVAVLVTVPGWLRAGLSNPRLVWLGKISYGLYLFHEVAFALCDHAAVWLGGSPNLRYLRPVASLAVTVALASASYYAVERPFLKLKRGWTRVPSRPV